jgi:DNA integrity scanning protein DisA with diadenylate cyclase activity
MRAVSRRLVQHAHALARKISARAVVVNADAIDGAFVVRDDGVVSAAGVHLTPSALGATQPSGLGTRHAPPAAITASTSAVAVAISESTGMVSVFRAGQMVADIHKPSNGLKEPT